MLERKIRNAIHNMNFEDQKALHPVISGATTAIGYWCLKIVE